MSLPELTPEEKALASRWGITDEERDKAFEALSLTLADLVDAKKEEADRQRGKDAFSMKILQDVANMAPDPYKPEISYAKEDRKMARAKKPKEEGERKYTEHTFQPKFDSWFLKNRHRFSTSVLIELKTSDGSTFNYSHIRSNQDEALQNCTGDKGVYHRIESAPHKYQSKKPSDSFFIRNAKGYLAVMYRQKEIGQKEFFIIPYPALIAERAKGEASLSEQRAGEIGIKCTL